MKTDVVSNARSLYFEFERLIILSYNGTFNGLFGIEENSEVIQ